MATDGSDAPVRAPANLRGALYSLLAYGIYSAHDVVVKLLGATYSPFQIVFFTMLFGFPVVTVMLMHDRTDGNLRPRHPWWLALRTVAMVISTPAAFYAFSVLPLAQTYTILFAAPLLITLLAILASLMTAPYWVVGQNGWLLSVGAYVLFVALGVPKFSKLVRFLKLELDGDDSNDPKLPDDDKTVGKK